VPICGATLRRVFEEPEARVAVEAKELEKGVRAGRP
jgi:archaeosine-15-forming tRNA-guanine transglycosylase